LHLISEENLGPVSDTSVLGKQKMTEPFDDEWKPRLAKLEKKLLKIKTKSKAKKLAAAAAKENPAPTPPVRDASPSPRKREGVDYFKGPPALDLNALFPRTAEHPIQLVYSKKGLRFILNCDAYYNFNEWLDERIIQWSGKFINRKDGGMNTCFWVRNSEDTDGIEKKLLERGFQEFLKVK
jgi:hypothetical protein